MGRDLRYAFSDNNTEPEDSPGSGSWDFDDFYLPRRGLYLSWGRWFSKKELVREIQGLASDLTNDSSSSSSDSSSSDSSDEIDYYDAENIGLSIAVLGSLLSKFGDHKFIWIDYS